MEFNLHIDPLFGDLYLLIKSHPYRDSNILSSIDNASKPELVSIEDKDDENFPTDKTYLRIKLERFIQLRFLLLICLILMVPHLICHPNNMDKRSRLLLVKLLMTIKNIPQYSGHLQFVFSVHDYQKKWIYNYIINHIEYQEDEDIFVN